jgi:carbamate kinase
LSELNVSDAKKYMKENHFAKGSMLPKVEAVLDFVEDLGGIGIITSPDLLDKALNGKAGTKIVS